ncbi:hypothetical protein ACIO3S_17865 [Nocardioides sp. NPDC087217]|uniref:hypothetical protein n=1 Tax=Nocardioides sp. NPDC087217 TaxID=3364335 RepID=UPI0038264D8A
MKTGNLCLRDLLHNEVGIAVLGNLELFPAVAIHEAHQDGDLHLVATPTTAYYSDGIAIAKALLNGVAQKLDAGGEVACAFLIRTPEAMEAGGRALLADALSPDFTVAKRGLTLVPSRKTLNPDLVSTAWRSATSSTSCSLRTGIRATSTRP